MGTRYYQTHLYASQVYDPLQKLLTHTHTHTHTTHDKQNYIKIYSNGEGIVRWWGSRNWIYELYTFAFQGRDLSSIKLGISLHTGSTVSAMHSNEQLNQSEATVWYNEYNTDSFCMTMHCIWVQMVQQIGSEGKTISDIFMRMQNIPWWKFIRKCRLLNVGNKVSLY